MRLDQSLDTQIVMEDYGGINHQQQLLEILEHQALLDVYILKLIGLLQREKGQDYKVFQTTLNFMVLELKETYRLEMLYHPSWQKKSEKVFPNVLIGYNLFFFGMLKKYE